MPKHARTHAMQIPRSTLTRPRHTCTHTHSWQDGAWHEVRYKRKYEEYWAFVQDVDQSSQPGVTKVHLNVGMSEYTHYRNHVGELVNVIREWGLWSRGKIIGISGLAQGPMRQE